MNVFVVSIVDLTQRPRPVALWRPLHRALGRIAAGAVGWGSNSGIAWRLTGGNRWESVMVSGEQSWQATFLAHAPSEWGLSRTSLCCNSGSLLSVLSKGSTATVGDNKLRSYTWAVQQAGVAWLPVRYFCYDIEHCHPWIHDMESTTLRSNISLIINLII